MQFIVFVLILFYIHGVTSNLYWENYLREKAICHLPVHYGNCRTKVAAWYYNPKQKACIRFMYALCEGNRNRFATREDCEKFCLKEWLK
nr:kunitz-type serine protease inhibitor homolog delta-dendrotoxin-like [Drosophila kikkawai]